jgi:hypothetical protein
MTTDVDPDAPADPEAAALDLIVRLPIDLLAAEGLRSVLQDYAGVLHCEGVFAGMAWADASRAAAAVVMDVRRRCLRDDLTSWSADQEVRNRNAPLRDDAGDFLRDRARSAAAGTDNVAWHDRTSVARALNTAATAFEL